MELRAGYKNTEIGVIPEDWECSKIGDITNAHAGGTPSTQNSSYWNGNIRWMNSGELNLKYVSEVENRITEVGLNNSSTKLIPKFCILVGLAGQGKTRGTVAINSIELCTNQSIAAIYPSKIYESKYLYFYLDSQYLELRKISTGDGGRGGLNLRIIKNIRIPLPKLSEQKAISEVLSDTDELIQNLEKRISKKRNIKQGAMQKLLTPKEGWETKKLGEVARYRRGSFPQPYGLPQWYDKINGTPFVQVYDVGKNLKLKETTKQKISDLATDKSIFVKKGNIILTIQGSIGRIAMTQYDAYVDRTLLIFTDYIVPMDKMFFLYIVLEIFRIEKQNAPGGIIKTITKAELSKFKISYPKLGEQNRIATILSDMDTEIERLEEKLDKYKDVKQGLMQQLLTGKIRLV